MARSLKVRKPSTAEIQRLQRLIEVSPDGRQRRRAEILQLYGAGLPVPTIVDWLGVHVNTVYTVLHQFGRHGLSTSLRVRHGGAPTQLTTWQITRLQQLAERSPVEQGLPYGRWSLAKLRNYAIEQRLIKQLSREHLRRLLKKGASGSNASNANLSVKTHNACQFWREFAGFGDSYPDAAICCFSM